MHKSMFIYALVAAVGLALTACGSSEPQATGGGPATLEIASVPSGEVTIDGTSHGTTPVEVTLDAGEHRVSIQRDHFTPFEETVAVEGGKTITVDTVLVGQDPADPEVIRILSEASEIAYEAPEELGGTRGSRRNEPTVVLLWPKEDVRLDGLTSYGLEASSFYNGDGYVVFKSGRKVLYREPFVPERVQTIEVMPEAVREALKSGDKVKWGVEFDDGPKPVLTTFKIVKSTKTEKAIAKLEKRKHYRRQAPITQALLRAQVLQNHRLYTESLVAHLQAAQEFPTSVQPYEGIVRALRRLDAEESELWALTSPFVAGRGGRAGRPGPMPRPGTIPLNLYDPGATARTTGPSGPTLPPVSTRPTEEPVLPTRPDNADAPRPDDATTRPGDEAADLAREAVGLRELAAEAQRRQDDAQSRADAASQGLSQLRAQKRAAESQLETSEANLVAAQQQYEADPTQANEVALQDAHSAHDRAQTADAMLAQQADAAAAAARRAAQEAESATREANDLAFAADNAARAAEAAGGQLPATGPDRPAGPDARELAGLRGQVGKAARELDSAQRDEDQARAELRGIEARLLGDPSNAGLERELDDARNALANMERARSQKRQAYMDALGRLPGAAAPSSAQGPDLPALQETMQKKQVSFDQAQEGYEAARAALQGDPGDPALQQAFQDAMAARDAADSELRSAILRIEDAMDPARREAPPADPTVGPGQPGPTVGPGQPGPTVGPGQPGPTVGPQGPAVVPPGSQGPAIADMKRQVHATGVGLRNAEQAADQALAEVRNFEERLLGDPGNVDLERELDEARNALAHMERDRTQKRQAYMEALARLAGGTTAATPALDLEGLNQAMAEKQLASDAAQVAYEDAKAALQGDPGDPALQQAFQAAMAARNTADADLRQAIDAIATALDGR